MAIIQTQIYFLNLHNIGLICCAFVVLLLSCNLCLQLQSANAISGGGTYKWRYVPWRWRYGVIFAHGLAESHFRFYLRTFT